MAAHPGREAVGPRVGLHEPHGRLVERIRQQRRHRVDVDRDGLLELAQAAEVLDRRREAAAVPHADLQVAAHAVPADLDR